MSKQNPYAKVVHKAGKMNEAGQVSALCYKRPRPIDLKRASYTIFGDPTCPKCKAVMAFRAPPAQDAHE